MDTIRIGTRKSKLALWQARWIAEKLNDHGLSTDLVLMETKGDKVLDVSIAKIGSKGVFTEELEGMLATGEIDIAVHSAKDMQSTLGEGFELIAFSEREDVADVLVSHQEITLSEDKLTIGTSSTRRVATLKHFYPQIKTVDMRGNLQTRIAKMKSGVCDALLLAYAGIHRMGYGELIREKLGVGEFIPAVGQGSIAIESHRNVSEEKKATIRQVINDPKTEKQLLAERAFLKKLEGGCSIPVFALAKVEGPGVSITGGIISLDGRSRMVRNCAHQDPERAGIQLADEILKSGGDKILAEIREQL